MGEAEPDLTAPLLGQHSSALLRQLGYDEAQIASLLQQGAAVEADADAPLWGKVAPPKKSVG